MKRVILFEFVDEVKKYLKEYGCDALIQSNILVVSLDPKVQTFLKSKKIPCITTLEFFNTQSQIKVLARVESILQKILPTVSFCDEQGVTRTYHHFFAFSSGLACCKNLMSAGL